ncbi:unnamed protein product, partial [marine sediment metagenome]
HPVVALQQVGQMNQLSLAGKGMLKRNTIPETVREDLIKP